MKVTALLTDCFGGNGGIALYCRHLMTAVAQMQRVNHIVAIPRIAPLYDYEHPIPDKIDYQTFASKSNFSYLRHILKQSFNSGSDNVIICAHIHLLIFAVFLKITTGAKIILILYGIEAWDKPDKLLVNWCLKRVDHVTCISRLTRDKFIGWSNFPESKISLLPNGIETEKYGIAQKPGYLQARYQLQDCKVLLTVGRLEVAEGAKGFDLVIRILPQLLKTHADIRYLVAGSGNGMHRLQAIARECGVEQAVIFTGQIDEQEKADHYRLADVYIMPSRLEGFGFVYLEAMACGIPVIGSAIDGSRDALLDGALGILVNPDDMDQITQAVLDTLNQPKKIPEKLDQFSIERFHSKFQGIVQSISKTT